MEAAFIAAFCALCLVATVRRSWALVLVLLMHPLEQVMQAHSPILRSSTAGSKAVNVAVGAVVLLAVLRDATRSPRSLQGMLNSTWISTCLLFVWSIVTLTWSPGRESGVEIVISQLPYFLVIVVASPLLAKTADDLTQVAVVMLVLGSALAFITIVSPEFSTFQGRLSFEFTAGIRSNTLAIGEMGGTVLILSACLRRGLPGGVGFGLRIVGMLVGTLLALKSGARGQFFLAVIVAIGFTPVAAPIRNLTGFIGGVLGIAMVAILATTLSSTLEGFAARRFSIEEMLYGASSAGSRVSNLSVLLSAWITSPFALLFGLGYNAFSTLSEGLGDPYSHILFADAICELGLPGAVLLGIAIFSGATSALRLLSRHLNEPRLRAGIAATIALFAYQLILVNKQGALWGVAPLFPLMAVLARAERIEEVDQLDSGGTTESAA